MTDVSVIIPVYNVEKWLPACLDSVLAQTLGNFEIVCVNDCSPDGCATILEDYAAHDQRIRVITLDKNSGQGVARNVGFAASNGKYVYFLDSDDMIAPESLEELFACAEKNELDGIFFDSQVIFDSPELEKRHMSYPARRTGSYAPGVTDGLSLFEAFSGQNEWTCYVQRQFWRAGFLRKLDITFPSWAPHEDEGFAFEAIVQAKRVMYLPRPYFIRRYREGSAMTSKMGGRNLRSYVLSLVGILNVSHRLNLQTEGVKKNSARIFFACKRIYDRLVKENVDPSSFFEDDPALLSHYLVFESSQTSYLHYAPLSPYAQERAQQAQKIYLYGAGELANNVFEQLAHGGKAIEGFLVSDPSANPAAYKGLHVHGVRDIPCDPEALVIVSVTDGFREEVEQLLDAQGWQHVFCREKR